MKHRELGLRAARSHGRSNWYPVSAILLSIVGSAGTVLSFRARRGVT